MSLTDTALKALKPRETSYIASDDRGLYVEVLPSSSIVWVLLGRSPLSKPFASNALNQALNMLQAWSDDIDELVPSANLLVWIHLGGEAISLSSLSEKHL